MRQNEPLHREMFVGAKAANRPLPQMSKPGGQTGPQKQGAQFMILDCALAAAQSLN